MLSLRAGVEKLIVCDTKKSAGSLSSPVAIDVDHTHADFSEHRPHSSARLLLLDDSRRKKRGSTLTRRNRPNPAPTHPSTTLGASLQTMLKTLQRTQKKCLSPCRKTRAVSRPDGDALTTGRSCKRLLALRTAFRGRFALPPWSELAAESLGQERQEAEDELRGSVPAAVV